MTVDDRSTRARIRDAAITCFARHGRVATTARLVADEAVVSPGSVIHHFRTMDGLRRACDEHVLATIREIKTDGAEQGLDLDLAGALRSHPQQPWLAAYLARMLVDEEASGPLVDDMVADAERYLERSVASGQVRPSRDPRARAIVLTLQALAPLVMHVHMDRLLGVDLTRPDLTPEQTLAYVRPALELYAEGLLTAEFAAANRALLDGGVPAHDEEPPRPDQDLPPPGSDDDTTKERTTQRPRRG